jgi:hypothetical protein
MEERLNALAKEGAKPLFLLDQFKVVMKNMAGKPVMPMEEDFDEDALMADKPNIGTAHDGH